MKYGCLDRKVQRGGGLVESSVASFRYRLVVSRFFGSTPLLAVLCCFLGSTSVLLTSVRQQDLRSA